MSPLFSLDGDTTSQADYLLPWAPGTPTRDLNFQASVVPMVTVSWVDPCWPYPTGQRLGGKGGRLKDNDSMEEDLYYT